MRIFIHTRTTISIAPMVLLDTIKVLVQVYTRMHENQICIVGSELPASFTSFCNETSQVCIVSEKESMALYKKEPPHILFHFGATIKAANQIPHFFIPLSLPKPRPYSFIQNYLLNKRFVQWINKAHKVLCINDWAYAVMQAQFPAYTASLHNVYLPSLAVPKFEWQDLSKAQESLTRGNNYYLCFAPVQRFTAILKSFSQFKKWQHTTMHLVFVFDRLKDKELAMEQLKGYKFKNDIVVICTDELCMEWIAATYAILWEGVDFSKSIWMLYAVAYEVPLLLDSDLRLPSSWLHAGESFSFTEPQSLSNHFKLYYKDEMYRQSKAIMAKNWFVNLNEQQAASRALDITSIQ